MIDQKGQTITTIETKALRSGPNKVHWDGKRLDGQKANKGTYTFQVHAWDEDNEPFLGETKTTGLVDGVRFSDGKTLLRLENGLEIFLHDVEKFEVPRHNKNKN